MSGSIIRTVVRRSKQAYVYYVPESGAITQIVFTNNNDGSCIELPNDHKVLVDIQSNKITTADCIVAYDKKADAFDLFVKNNYIRQLKKDHELTVVPQLADVDFTVQCIITVYGLDKSIEVELLQSALGSIVDSSVRLMSDIDIVDVWVVDKNDPNKLYGTLRCPMKTLLTSNRVRIPAPWWSDDLISRVQFITKSIFASYGWIYNAADVKPPYKSNTTYSIQTARQSNSDDCNVKITITKNVAVIYSYMNNPARYKIFDSLNIYLISTNDPSKYIGAISIPAGSIKEGIVSTIDLASLPDDVGMIYDNSFVSINYTIN